MLRKIRVLPSAGKKSRKSGLRLGLACLVILLAFSTTACNQLEDAFNLLERIMERLRDSEDTAEPPGKDGEAELNLTLYFADDRAADDMVGGSYGFVTPVKRTVFSTGGPLTAAITELISGPLPEDGSVGRTVPERAVLKEIGVSEGTAVLNFSKEFASEHPGGVLHTQITVESLVYTATEIPAVERVQVLVEGNPWADGYGFVWSRPIDRAGIADALHIGEEPIDTVTPLNDWDVYQNYNYGFALKHPDSWAVFEYERIDLQTGSILNESIFIAPQEIVEFMEAEVQEDGGIPGSPAGVPIVITRYPEIKVRESDEYTSVTSEAFIVDGRDGVLYTYLQLISVPGFDAGSVTYEAVLPTEHGSLTLMLQVEQYEDIFEQILLSFKFI
jgi:spore germination protein GerM